MYGQGDPGGTRTPLSRCQLGCMAGNPTTGWKSYHPGRLISHHWLEILPPRLEIHPPRLEILPPRLEILPPRLEILPPNLTKNKQTDGHPRR